ncbi:GntR family transcriptional regulator [Rhodococcus koreensis]
MTSPTRPCTTVHPYSSPGASAPDVIAFARESAFNRAKPEPIYYQLGESIMRALHQRRIPPGSPLPSHRALAGQWRVTLATVRSTISYLDIRGYLYRAGQRTYLVEPQSSAAPRRSPSR